MASTYARIIPSSISNRKTWTFSAWVKRSNTNENDTIFSSGNSTNVEFFLRINNDNTISVYNYQFATNLTLVTNRLFRDNNAWYHIVFTLDTTQATASDRAKLYINGVQETSFSSSIYPSQNEDLTIAYTDTIIDLGRRSSGSNQHFNGLMSHVHFCDGYAYSPTDFGEYDANGVWKIKTNVSVNYGTWGFFVLKDGNSVIDQSGNGNDLTVGGTALTNTEDSPSNVFTTWNPLVHASTSAVFSNGNTKVVPQDNSSVNYTTSTLAVSSGKYYAEFKKLQNDNRLAVGIIDTDLQTKIFQANSYLKDVVGAGIIYDSINGKISGNNGDIQTGLTTAGNNDIIGLAVDMDNKLFYVYVNGTLINSGGTGASFSYLTGTYSSFWVGDVAGDGYDSCEANFGNGYFGTTAVASAGTNASGIGIFEHDVPNGYTALSTKGLNL